MTSYKPDVFIDVLPLTVIPARTRLLTDAEDVLVPRLAAIAFPDVDDRRPTLPSIAATRADMDPVAAVERAEALIAGDSAYVRDMLLRRAPTDNSEDLSGGAVSIGFMALMPFVEAHKLQGINNRSAVIVPLAELQNLANVRPGHLAVARTILAGLGADVEDAILPAHPSDKALERLRQVLEVALVNPGPDTARGTTPGRFTASHLRDLLNALVDAAGMEPIAALQHPANSKRMFDAKLVGRILSMGAKDYNTTRGHSQTYGVLDRLVPEAS